MRYEHHLNAPAFTVENITILHVSREKDFKHAYRSGRPQHGFIYAVHGVLQCTFADEKKTVFLNEGDLLFVPQGCAYSAVYLEDKTELKIIQFDLTSGTLPAYLAAPQKIELSHVGDRIDAFFSPTKGTAPQHPFYTLSCLYDLLWRIDETYKELPTKYKRLRPALEEIDAHYTQNASVADYAALCGMSEVAFRRLFREFTGAAPVNYRNDIRLQNAKLLIASGEYNVSEAAAAVGFSNLSFFIRLYKKKYGYTPKKE